MAADALKNSGKLRGALGLKVGDARVAHHLIPVEMLDRGPVQAALEAGFEFNGKINGKAVFDNVHLGAHNDWAWNENVGQAIDNWASANKGYSPAQAKEFLENFAKQLGKSIPE